MRRGASGSRNATGVATVKQYGIGSRRSVTVDENAKANTSIYNSGDNQHATTGPVTARLKMLEKKYSQILEMQAKFNILDKWILQQFCIKLFPSPIVNMDKFSESNPEDAENPFYAVYLLCQRVKFLEEKVKQLEAFSYEDDGDLKPTSSYSSSHAFRNFKVVNTSGKAGGVKRNAAASAPTTPKKSKLASRPVPSTSNYPLKPSVKILPKDPNMATPVKKESEQLDGPSTKVSPLKQNDEIEIKSELINLEIKTEAAAVEEPVDFPIKIEQDEQTDTEKCEDVQEIVAEVKLEETDTSAEVLGAEGSPTENNMDDVNDAVTQEITAEESNNPDPPIVFVSTPEPQVTPPLVENKDEREEEMDIESGLEDVDMDAEQKPLLTALDEEMGGDVSGSEASVSSLASSSSKLRLSTRNRKPVVPPAVAVATSSSGKNAEDEKPVMYTARGRRHTVPRRYAEFTGHDNVVSILKSQQRAEKSAAAAGTSKGTKRQVVTPTKSHDTPPKIKKMVKAAKTPSPKKVTVVDSEGDGDSGQGKKKCGPNAVNIERPPSVDALVDKVMAREVDSDGMVVLSESFSNIFVNQQQLISVVVRSNGKSTRLTRKMTTLVFEDSVLASASPFGTKYYKDRLPPEPLEAMVDFIAESGFEPHYSKKKIYMIVGQVCNEARAGRVSKKFMQPLESTPSTPSGPQSHDSNFSPPPSPLPPTIEPQELPQ